MTTRLRQVLWLLSLCIACGDREPKSPTPRADAGLDPWQGLSPSDASLEASEDAGRASEPDAGSPEPDAAVVKSSTDLTYHADMLPLFEKHCVPCHEERGTGPFSIRHYPSVHSHRYAIRGATHTREMPPCGSAPISECGLTEDELASIADWVEGGAPEGQAEE